MKFDNPATIHPPLGLYSHTASVREGTELVFISGQVGIRPDGSTPEGIAEQSALAFANIGALLDSHGLDVTDIVKLVTFVVHGNDGDAVMAARREFLGGHSPVSTTLIVAGLVSPLWHVEVEAIAARARAEN